MYSAIHCMQSTVTVLHCGCRVACLIGFLGSVIVPQLFWINDWFQELPIITNIMLAYSHMPSFVPSYGANHVPHVDLPFVSTIHYLYCHCHHCNKWINILFGSLPLLENSIQPWYWLYTCIDFALLALLHSWTTCGTLLYTQWWHVDHGGDN